MFLSKVLLLIKTWKDLNYNSYLAHNYVTFYVDILFDEKDEPDTFSATEEVHYKKLLKSKNKPVSKKTY